MRGDITAAIPPGRTRLDGCQNFGFPGPVTDVFCLSVANFKLVYTTLDTLFFVLFVGLECFVSFCER